MTTKLKWEGSWQNTWAFMPNGVELRVKFLPGSAMWGMYVNGKLRGKEENRVGTSRARAKYKVKNRYGYNAEPSNKTPCVHCGGTGWVKKPA